MFSGDEQGTTDYCTNSGVGLSKCLMCEYQLSIHRKGG